MPITDEQRQQVLRLAREGTLSRNQIAKDVGVSAGSVTNICKAAGVSFDRTATEVAVRSRKADLAARRAELQLQLLQDAARLREQLWQPATYTELGKFSAAKGEGGAFVQNGGIAPGGRLAVNTNGGGLSCVHPGMYGIFALIEAVRQLRGEAGVRQLQRHRTAVVHGNGGTLSSQSTAVLGTADTL